jgi:hypothetical protein
MCLMMLYPEKAFGHCRSGLMYDKMDKNQMEGLRSIGEIQSNEKSDFVRFLSDLIRVNTRY